MAIIKTVNFLPEIFRTDTNAKFLNATLDQLINEPQFKRVDGYIGRKFSPTYKSTDNYVVEPSKPRQQYQLEPSIIVNNKDNDSIDFYSSYLDLLQQIQYYGGNITNQSRLFKNESYSFDGQFDYDKFINFKNYYWLENGPACVPVSSGNVPTHNDYDVTRNITLSGYNFSESGTESNPVLVMARGGTYTFNINEPGHQFWIQTEPGISGKRAQQQNISTREVFGVANNGTDAGTVTFKVPLVTAQNRYSSMPVVDQIDIASVDIHYSEIQGSALSAFLRKFTNGIDGAKTYADLHNRNMIFATTDDSLDESYWSNNEFFAMLRFGAAVKDQVVPAAQRRNIWRITLVPSTDVNPDSGLADDYIINLIPSTEVQFDNRVYVRNGIVAGTREYYLDFDNMFHPVPVITSNLDVIYYQDSVNPAYFGEIRIIDANNFSIDVTSSILNKVNYTSPNGVVFTNGLKVCFDEYVTPALYANNEYYVEGVGSSITLIPVSSLVAPEEYAINGLSTPDYLTVNRASIDLNGWTRSNRWFHVDIITETANYNKDSLIYTYTYDPDFNNEFVPYTDSAIVSTIRSLTAIESLKTEYQVGQIFYAYIEGLFFQLDAEMNLVPLANFRATNSSLPDQTLRATRPIIEFNAGTKLFNYGHSALDPVDYLDFTVTDAFSDIERSGSVYNTLAPYLNGDVVIVGDQVYGATKNVQSLPTDSTVWNQLFQLVPYDSSRPYLKDEKVSFNGSAYQALNYADVAPSEANEDELWFKLFDYVSYDPELADTYTINTVVDYAGIAYRALEDIQQNPATSGLWELLFNLIDGKTIIFANEDDPEIRKRVYTIRLVEIAGQDTIHLELASDRLVQPQDAVIVKSGQHQSENFWYNGTNWYQGQSKSGVNQAPKFDVVDENGISFGDRATYVDSTFNGTTIFEYAVGTGTRDTVLGFPLTYKNFNSVGDIEFLTRFNTDTFTFVNGIKVDTKQVRSGYLLQINQDLSLQHKNIWTKNVDDTKQFQLITHQYGTDGINYFEIDCLPDIVTTTPNLKVYVNNLYLKREDFRLEKVGTKTCMVINPDVLTPLAKVDILIYTSTAISSMGYYEIPLNLDFNSENLELASLTLGQVKDHFIQLEEHSNIIHESVGSFTRQRDIEYKSNTGTILQHAYPVLYSNLFLTNDTTSLIDSLDLASREYSKFKNKFLELASKIADASQASPAELVDAIITEINANKDASFPFYHSDMVPYGTNRAVYADTVINPNSKQFDLPAVFNDTELGNTAILVYINETQLIKDVDYYFPQDRTAVTLTDAVTLQVDDIIRVVEYYNTWGSYVPETPSKLGLYPKFQPMLFADATYVTTTNVIQGHDGSITPAFNDFRDTLLLELEKRIFNNIKVNYESNIFDLRETLPGFFRSTGYSDTEWKQILNRNFLKWAGFNQVDYSTHTGFTSANPWTWNYKNQINKLNGTKLPGSWRAIYLSLFDTCRPHTNPWEMLGFSSEPSWWADRYGAAPYTGGNVLLWEDLEKGYIHSGPTAGINSLYARPGLTSIIPVNDYGELKSPNEFVTAGLDTSILNSSYEVGTMGPAEYSWVCSSDYPFAIQRAIALAKPAFYFGSLLNIKRYRYSEKLDQLVNVETLRRISPTDVVIPNSVNADGTTNFVAGYLSWIVEFMKYRGVDAQTELRQLLDNCSVQLSYKAAGFTSKNYINVLAEQSSPTSTNDSIIIPDENYRIILNKSTPIKKVVYSGVIVERSDNGFTIGGYDLTNPYFTIIPSLANNNNHTVSLLNSRVVVYHDYQPRKIHVPYGHEFANIQQVTDFLISYGRFLVGQGFMFNTRDPQLNEDRNWELSVKEFLAWESQGWQAGSLLILSPAFDRINLVTPGATVDYVSNVSNGSKVLNQNFQTIKSTEFTINRQNNEFSIETLDGATICLFEGRLVQWEHVMVFDNTTVFNDVIYLPELGNRQFRLKLIGNKTAAWAGELNPAGFIYNSPDIDSWEPHTDYRKGKIIEYKTKYYVSLRKLIGTAEFELREWQQIDRYSIKTGLLPNLAFSAQQFEHIYDVENGPVDERLQEFSGTLIGLRKRKYLDDLNLDFTSQMKFYQGFIKEKGTKNAVTALTNANFNNISSEIEMYEEWAVRVGEYGALESDAQIEIVLDDTKFTNDPSAFNLLDGLELPTPGVVPVYKSDLYRTTSSVFKRDLFFARGDDSDYSKDIATAGFVNLADVNATVFDLTNYNALNTYLKQLADGWKIWVAKDFDLNWNVYRITNAEFSVVAINYEIDNVMSVEFSNPHNLDIGDIFCIKGFDSKFDGFYRVREGGIDTGMRVLVDLYQNADYLKEARTIADNGMVFHMDSLRVDDPMHIDLVAPKRGWKNGDKVWVDQINSQEQWGVYEKTNPWSVLQEVVSQPSDFIGEDGFGAKVKLNINSDLALVSAPAAGAGRVNVFVWLPEGNFVQTTKLQAPDIDPATVGFGDTLSISDYTAVIAAPANNKAFVYNFRVGTSGLPVQIISLPVGESIDSKYGQSVDISEDGQWIHVGAPGINKVYSYHKNDEADVITDSVTVTNYTAGQTYTLPFTPYSEDSIVVKYDETQILTPGVDYTFDELANEITVLGTVPLTISKITIQQGDHYTLVGALLVPGIESTAQFGAELITDVDGSELFVTAPMAEVSGIAGAGRVFSFDRRTEIIKSNANLTTYRHSEDIVAVSDIFIGDVRLVKGLEYSYNQATRDITINVNNLASVNFTSGLRIKVSSDEFDLTHEISQPESDIVPNGMFGYVIDTDEHAAAIFISAPGYRNSSYASGKVYRYIKPSRYYGTVTSKVANPVLTPGLNLYINGFQVIATGDSVNTLASDINSAQLPGISSFVDSSGYITIQSTSKVNRSKLFLSCAGNNLLSQMDIGNYVLAQEITVPGGANNDLFGISLRVTNDSNTLLIGNGNTTTRLDCIIDANTTLVDNGSTTFKDITFGSQVYTYELLENEQSNLSNPGKLIYVQKFDVISGRLFQQFGTAIDIRKGKVLIGDFGDDTITNNGGTAWLYTNQTGTNSWNLIRSQGETVDIDTVNRLTVYSKKSNTVLANLDYIDPAKGKILGIAEQDIDLKVAFDPAYYTHNPGANTINIDTISWGDEHVGTIWWDLSLVRYVDYEQGNLIYRLKNWGKLFPGSQVEICEWVESNVPPLQYTGSGEPKYSGNGSYVVKNTVDNATGILNQKYYFWVKNKTTSTIAGKAHSISVLADIIENPHLQGIPYATLLARNSLGLHSINQLLSGSDSVLQVRYDNLRNSNIIHSEYELLQERNPASTIPTKIISKLIDSLAGTDLSGRAVPDLRLLEQDRYGISIRPRQTMIKNRSEAIRNFVKAVNSVLINYPISQQRVLTGLLSADPIPKSTEYDFAVDMVDELAYINVDNIDPGYTVLVKSDSNNENLWSIWTLNDAKTFALSRIQTYKTSLYWDYVDWFASGYSAQTRPDYSVEYIKDVGRLSLVPAGSIIKVKYNQIGNFTLFKTKQYNNLLDLELIGLGNGTIQLSSRLYDNNNYTLGFGTDNFDNERFDINPSTELRKIFEALQNDIYIGELSAEFNKLFFNMIDYILYTQRDVDWIFKTSFVSVVHQLRELTQYPSFVKDNQDYYIDYINEVKPYRTKIREYLISYAGNDNYYGDVTDFDLPAYYESTINEFRSPSGEGINDDLLLSQVQYKSWVDNHELTLESIQVEQPGKGYTVPPIVIVYDHNGVETNVVAESRINPVTGQVTSIVIKSAGQNTYTATPYVVLNGNGTGATASATVRNLKIRSIATTIKFDRVAYRSNLVKWEATTSVVTGDLVYYNNVVYRAAADLTPSPIFDYRYFTKLTGNDAGTALDRIVAYYVSADGTPGEELLQNLVDGLVYPGVRVTGLRYEDESLESLLLDSYIQGTFLDTAIGTRPEDIDVDGGPYVDTNVSHGPQELIPGVTFDTLVMGVWTRVIDENNEVVSGPPIGYRVVHSLHSSSLVTPTEWISDFAYIPNSFVEFNGDFYMSTANIANHDVVVDPASSPDWRLVWSEPSEWDGSTSYVKGQLVSYDNKVWQAKASFNNKGTVATLIDLVISPSNVLNDMYFVTSEQTYYYWDGEANWFAATSMPWAEKTSYRRGDHAVFGTGLYKAIAGFRYIDEVSDASGLPADNDEHLNTGDIYYVTADSSYFRYVSIDDGWTDIGAVLYYQTSIWQQVLTTVDEVFGSTVLSQTELWSAINYENTPRAFTNPSTRQYYRISAESSTVLTQDLLLSDTVMHVSDASVLPAPDASRANPGIVYVNGEMITYYERDIVANTISRLSRGTIGTGAALVIPAGSRVDDVSKLQKLPQGSDSIDWLNSLTEFGFVEVGDFDYEAPGYGFAANAAYPNGDAPFDYSISISSGLAPVTDQARFLSNKPAYNP